MWLRRIGVAAAVRLAAVVVARSDAARADEADLADLAEQLAIAPLVLGERRLSSLVPSRPFSPGGASTTCYPIVVRLSDMADAEQRGAERRSAADLYGSFTRWGDALFELCDAVLVRGRVRSPRSPRSASSRSSPAATAASTRRSATGRIDEDRLRRLLVAQPAGGLAGGLRRRCLDLDALRRGVQPRTGLLLLGVASTQPASRSSRGGTTSGSASSSWAPDSWTAPLDAMRIPPGTDATDRHRRPDPSPRRAACQTTARCRCSCSTPAMTRSRSATTSPGSACEVLCRIRDDRVFYADPPPRPEPSARDAADVRHATGSGGSAPTLTSWPEPSANLVASDSRYGTVTVTAWHGMHPRLSGRGHWAGHDAPPIVRGSVIRVEVEHLPKPTAARRRRSGCGGRATASPISTGAGAPTSGASTSSTPSGSRRAPSAGRRHRCPRPSRPTVGPGSSSLASPSSDSRAVSSPTSGCPGNSPSIQLSSRRARVRQGVSSTSCNARHAGQSTEIPRHPVPGRPKGTRKPPRTRYPAIKKAA